MKDPSLTAFRVLGVVHVTLGLLLLPICLVFGLLLAPVLALGSLWLMILGIRLWRPSLQVRRLAWRTHWVAVMLAALLCAYGAFALQSARQSAAAGGGLLGAFGLLPLSAGILLGVTAVASLWLTHSLKAAGNGYLQRPPSSD